jgi:hypothetical protein
MSKLKQFTLTTKHEHTFTEGWGVSVDPVYSGEEDDSVADIDVTVVAIDRADAVLVGDVWCVAIAPRVYVPIDDFQHVDDLTVGDTHDLRTRWFATEEEAREHADGVEATWRNPSPWESFVTLH